MGGAPSSGPCRAMSKHAVAAVSELPPGTRKLVNVKGRAIAIFNIKGEFFALFNRCPHQGGSLWHGWEFDIRTGQSYLNPRRVKARNYPVEIETGTALAKGPYVAETVPIRVEDEYLVVTI